MKKLTIRFVMFFFAGSVFDDHSSGEPDHHGHRGDLLCHRAGTGGNCSALNDGIFFAS